MLGVIQWLPLVHVRLICLSYTVSFHKKLSIEMFYIFDVWAICSRLYDIGFSHFWRQYKCSSSTQFGLLWIVFFLAIIPYLLTFIYNKSNSTVVESSPVYTWIYKWRRYFLYNCRNCYFLIWFALYTTMFPCSIQVILIIASLR